MLKLSRAETPYGMDMEMKKLIILLVAVALLSAGVAHAQAKTAAVAIKNNAFDPKTVTIAKGDTVTWTNQDSYAHDVDLDALGKSPNMKQGEIFSKTFDQAGTYNYDCDIHPFMKGTVIVK